MAQELWQIAKPFGRPAKFKSPEELWDAFQRYCTWAENNPLTIGKERRQKNNAKGAEKSQRNEEAPRPLSLTAFRLHASIKREWCIFKADYSKRSQDFCRVLYAIEESVRQQQVDNALVGLYKENLVARINGLAEVTKQEVSGSVNTQQGMSVEKSREFLQQIESEI
jgi:hypothetical protein